MSVVLVGEQIPSVPADFQRRLSAFDPDLYVVWHKSPHSKQPGRWKIERCTRHFGKFDNGRPVHDHTCVRVYILMCQDEEGVPVPLGDWVFEKLREMRSNWEAFGGDTPRGIRNAIAISDEIDRARDQKREVERADIVDYNSRKFNRPQFQKLYDLVSRHDMRPNK